VDEDEFPVETERSLGAMRNEWNLVQAEIDRLLGESDQLTRESDRLRTESDRLLGEGERLREESERALQGSRDIQDRIWDVIVAHNRGGYSNNGL
jgi:FtsZ-binding cell division protein ZapB